MRIERSCLRFGQRTLPPQREHLTRIIQRLYRVLKLRDPGIKAIENSCMGEGERQHLIGLYSADTHWSSSSRSASSLPSSAATAQSPLSHRPSFFLIPFNRWEFLSYRLSWNVVMIPPSARQPQSVRVEASVCSPLQGGVCEARLHQPSGIKIARKSERISR